MSFHQATLILEYLFALNNILCWEYLIYLCLLWGNRLIYHCKPVCVFFWERPTLLQPNGGNKRELYLHEVTVWWRESAIICYHYNTLKRHNLSSHISPQLLKVLSKSFPAFAVLILHWRVQKCKLSPGGGYLCLTEGLRWLRREARLISGLFQKGESVALLWKTAFVRLSCVRTEGENLTKEMALFKADTKLGAFFISCLGVCSQDLMCIALYFNFIFSPTPFLSTHSFTQTYFFPVLFLMPPLPLPSISSCGSEICVHYQMKDEKNQQRTPRTETEIWNLRVKLTKKSSWQKDVSEQNVPCWKIQIKAS